ncbi:hypothetical protein OROGR_019527 [Orobanche gracilis]
MVLEDQTRTTLKEILGDTRPMVNKEGEDEMTMNFVINKLKNQGIYQFGLLRTEVYDEKMVEEFYQEAKFWTGAFEMCTGLRYRMMVAIMTGEPVNWCQIILKRLQEEVAKPATQKKSFGLVLNNILALSGVHIGDDAKSIGSGKFIGGMRRVAYNKTLLHASRPACISMPVAENPRILLTPANIIPAPQTQEETEAH